MRKAIYILIFLTFGFRCADKKDCQLKNGKYEVVYDKQFNNYSPWLFKLEDQKLTVLGVDSKSEFEMEWISTDRFKLRSTEKRTEPKTEIEKQLNSLEDPFYEVTKCSGDTLKFVFKRNEHITINAGKIIRRE